MSWPEQLEATFKITTGDGSEYDVLYVVGSNQYSFEFNISEFEFPEISGTKVDRRLPKGRRFPLEFYFQGPDHIETAEQFRISSHDLNPWTLLHPVYGQIEGHPISIEVDNSGINTSKITVLVVESINEDLPRVRNESRGTALAAVSTGNTSAAEFLENLDPAVTDVAFMQQTVDELYTDAVDSISDDAIAAEYFNLFTRATNGINNLLNDVTTAISTANAFIIYPAQFLIDVKTRLTILKNQAEAMSERLEDIGTPNEKQLFESQKGLIVSASIESTLNPITDDYKSAVDVLYVAGELTTLYNDFIDELGTLQTDDGTQPDSYLPNPDFLFNLNFAMNYAVANLLQIALSAEQERIIYLEAPSNLIIQAHRFYGLDDQDETIKRFIDTNDIQMGELLQIPKGRKLVYYI